MTDFDDLMTREGELSELTLMRHATGELDPDATRFVEERLASSLTDRRHAEELNAFVSENSIAAPPDLVEPDAQLEPGWWRSWRGLGVAAVAAAVLLIVLRPDGSNVGLVDGDMPIESGSVPGEPKSDEMRTKGREFDLRLQLEDEGRQRYGEPGTVVHPGERVQFVIYPRRAGHVMVVGIGPEGKVYPAHPRKPGNAVEVEASPTQVQLEGAMAFDEALGPERFVGIWCPTTFGYDDVATVLEGAGATLPHFRDGCLISAITLDKRERGAPDPDGPDAIDAFDPLGNVLEDDEEGPRPPDAAAEDPEEPEDPDEDPEEVLPQ
jgi:hypothetical protein